MTQIDCYLTYKIVARIPQVRAAFQFHLLATSVLQVCMLFAILHARRRGIAVAELELLLVYILAFTLSILVGIILLRRYMRQIVRVAIRANESSPKADFSEDFPLGEAERIGYRIHGRSYQNILARMTESLLLVFFVIGLPIVLAPSSDLLFFLMVTTGFAHLTLVVFWYWVLPVWTTVVIVSPEGVSYSSLRRNERILWDRKSIILLDSDKKSYLLLKLGSSQREKYALVPLAESDKRYIISLAVRSSQKIKAWSSLDDSYPSPAN